jgi:hypothetical protein
MPKSRDGRLPGAVFFAALAALLALRLLTGVGSDSLGIGFGFLSFAAIAAILALVWRYRQPGLADSLSIVFMLGFVGATFLTIFVPEAFALPLWIAGAVCLVLAMVLLAFRSDPV